ncbi:hypothetical protein D3C72_1230210 [compost metagenome]
MRKKVLMVFLIPSVLIIICLVILLIKHNSKSNIDENGQVKYLQSEIENIFILLDEENQNIENIKNKYQSMYQNTPNIMLELYEKGINQEKILGFNDMLDNVLHEMNTQNISKVFEDLSDLYGFLPDFIVNDDLYKNILEIKINIYKCRSALNNDDWDRVNKYNQQAVQEYIDILNSVDERLNQKQVNVTYITINEMDNAIKLRDKAIYLIKYKFLLEQLNSI